MADEGRQAEGLCGFSKKVGPDGHAVFRLRMNQIYQVGAFTDTNGNRALDAGEPFGRVVDVAPMALTETSRAQQVLRIKLAPAKLEPGTRIEVPVENRSLGGRIRLDIGEVVSLDDPRFATAAGGAGLWKPFGGPQHGRPGGAPGD